MNPSPKSPPASGAKGAYGLLYIVSEVQQNQIVVEKNNGSETDVCKLLLILQGLPPLFHLSSVTKEPRLQATVR